MWLKIKNFVFQRKLKIDDNKADGENKHFYRQRCCYNQQRCQKKGIDTNRTMTKVKHFPEGVREHTSEGLLVCIWCFNGK